jgi:hypothetical protein
LLSNGLGAPTHTLNWISLAGCHGSNTNNYITFFLGPRELPPDLDSTCLQFTNVYGIQECIHPALVVSLVISLTLGSVPLQLEPRSIPCIVSAIAAFLSACEYFFPFWVHTTLHTLHTMHNTSYTLLMTYSNFVYHVMHDSIVEVHWVRLR